ncbi:S8 family serine peptidase [Streptomyces sp. S6]
MPTPHPAPIPGARRAVRIAAATGLAAALAGAGLTPEAFATPATTPTTASVPAPDSSPDKLGSHDARLLAQAVARRDKNVTLMIATAPGQTGQVARELGAVDGGSVGRTYDRLGYVRATVPTGRARAAVAAAERLSSVQAIDLRAELPQEAPELDASGHGSGVVSRASAPAHPGPSADTPARNPYNPTFETGAVDFVHRHPKADGRGVTIGLLDTGVDLDTPALQRTTTGERKIVDWVTSTDPVIDGDGTWLPMTTPVTGPAFEYGGRTWKAPAGSYRIGVFHESATRQGKVTDSPGHSDGDVNRDGDTTDVFGVLYDPAAGTVTVDVDGNGDFTDDTPMKPYKDGFQVGHFGTDDPATAVVERQAFVVQIRKDVPMDPMGGDWTGKKADFVDIGLVAGAHGTHTAGIMAGHGLFGGRMDGAAPGAKIVSSRGCAFTTACTNTAITEGMIDLVVNHGVDLVEMTVNGAAALNDGNDVFSTLYDRLLATYGVPIVVPSANTGPGANTTGDLGAGDGVISVGASVSRATYAADYGAEVAGPSQVFTFSGRGPAEDGGLSPAVVAPGAAVSTIPAWMPGSSIAESGWKLPPGYAMYNGTSMSSPQAAGASALLLSAAKQRHIAMTAVKLRTALTSTARHVPGAQAYEEGAGLIDVPGAWKAIEAGATAHDYTVKAPVDTVLAGKLRTPGFGRGVHDREGGLKVGQRRTYDVVITRTSGPAGSLSHVLRLVNDKDRTFSVAGPRRVDLPLGVPVTVKLRAAPRSAGVKSVLLTVDDPRTPGVDKQILDTVVVSAPLHHTFTASGSVRRTTFRSYFVTVPPGTKSLEIGLSGLKEGSRTFFTAVDPSGLTVADDDPDTALPASVEPMPGVWEITVDARRKSAALDNPYRLTVSAFAASFDPARLSVPEARIGVPASGAWTLTNRMAAVDGRLEGGTLGSSRTARPVVAKGAAQRSTVVVPEGTTSLDVAIGGAADPAADLDLTVLDARGEVVGRSAGPTADESVSVANPAAGTYTVEVVAYAAPSGSTAYDYHDVFFSPVLGKVTVDEATPVRLGTGGSVKVPVAVTAAAGVAEGRELVGGVRLVNTRGTLVGAGDVTVEKVVP